MTAACDCCGHTRKIECRGLCRTCRGRAAKYGSLQEWGYVKADRLTEYQEMRAAGYTAGQSAWTVGVSERTGQRYENELAAAGQAPWKAAA